MERERPKQRRSARLGRMAPGGSGVPRVDECGHSSNVLHEFLGLANMVWAKGKLGRAGSSELREVKSRKVTGTALAGIQFNG